MNGALPLSQHGPNSRAMGEHPFKSLCQGPGWNVSKLWYVLQVAHCIFLHCSLAATTDASAFAGRESSEWPEVPRGFHVFPRLRNEYQIRDAPGHR